MDDQTGCRSSCMILQFRQCLYQRLSVAFERCPADQDPSSNIGNGTHRWLPCSGGACVTTRSIAAKTTTAVSLNLNLSSLLKHFKNLFSSFA